MKVEPVIEEESPRKRPDVSWLCNQRLEHETHSGSYMTYCFIDKNQERTDSSRNILKIGRGQIQQFKDKRGQFDIDNLEPATVAAGNDEAAITVSVGNEISGVK